MARPLQLNDDKAECHHRLIPLPFAEHVGRRPHTGHGFGDVNAAVGDPKASFCHGAWVWIVTQEDRFPVREILEEIGCAIAPVRRSPLGYDKSVVTEVSVA